MTRSRRRPSSVPRTSVGPVPGSSEKEKALEVEGAVHRRAARQADGRRGAEQGHLQPAVLADLVAGVGRASSGRPRSRSCRRGSRSRATGPRSRSVRGPRPGPRRRRTRRAGRGRPSAPPRRRGPGRTAGGRRGGAGGAGASPSGLARRGGSWADYSEPASPGCRRPRAGRLRGLGPVARRDRPRAAEPAGQRRRGVPGHEEHGAAGAVPRRAARGPGRRRGALAGLRRLGRPRRGAAGASLLEAVSGSVAVVGTTGREVAGARTPRRLAAEAEALAGGGTLSLVFGPEASGLTRRRAGPVPRASCTCRRTRSSPRSTSRRPCCSWRTRCGSRPSTAPAPPAGDAGAGAGGRGRAGDGRAAGRAARDRLPRPREPGPHPDGAAPADRARRAQPREVVLLRGLARQVAWAGRVARGGAGPDNPPGERDDDGRGTGVRGDGRPRVPGPPAAAGGGGALRRRARPAGARLPAGGRGVASRRHAGRGVDERPGSLLPLPARRRGPPGDPEQGADHRGDGGRVRRPRRGDGPGRGRRCAACTWSAAPCASRATSSWTCPPTTRASSTC